MKPTSAPARTGARRRAEIPAALLRQLNAGEAETRTLVEGLAIDFAQLLCAAAPELSPAAVAQMQAAASEGVTRRCALAGALLHADFGLAGYERFRRHRSDTVRGWAACLLASVPELPLADRLERMRPLADDPHAGVREWAWLALRPHVAGDLGAAIRQLTRWTGEESPFLRRFASEATRPRGVWCAHLGPLKERPELGLPLLEPLRADPEKYVQDSVGNWLNDAAKSRPEFVLELCLRWRAESPAPATERICRRALRSL